MGSFGAIAEFHHVPGDPPYDLADDLTLITARGGIRLASLAGVRPVAFETLSVRPECWSQSVALCLPADDAAMNARGRLTELGPDTDALRQQDREGVLFDMGLAQPQVDFCIRTADPELLTLLRMSQGRSLFDPDNPALGAILNAHPHRIAITRLGRVEVFQMIGGPDTGGVSPQGPHTHVLPKLLRTGRTHSANVPIPPGWVPCASLHPKSPVFDRLGHEKDFDVNAFVDFQKLLTVWGIPDYSEAKRDVWAALKVGGLAEDHLAPTSRIGRAGLRNALRQWSRQNGDGPLVRSWLDRFDRGSSGAEDDVSAH